MLPAAMCIPRKCTPSLPLLRTLLGLLAAAAAPKCICCSLARSLGCTLPSSTEQIPKPQPAQRPPTLVKTTPKQTKPNPTHAAPRLAAAEQCL